MTSTTETMVDAGRPARRRQLGRLGQFVDRRVGDLQQQYLDRRADAVAKLARLRRGLGKPPGAIPELWQVVFDGLPASSDRGVAAPTFDENAAYTALTLYATHQQSRLEPMHHPGQSLGNAVRILRHSVRRSGGSEEAVCRRFESLGTAIDFSEIAHHGRGLVSLLRTHAIPLDYGLLAEELLWLQLPGHANRVRLAWGRDFYRSTDNNTDPGNTPAEAADQKETP